MSDPILNVADLTLRISGKRILADVSFCLPSLGMTALMGPVGSGKSTLLKCLTRNAPADIYDATCSLAVYADRTIDDKHAPVLYAQRQAQPRDELMARLEALCAGDPALICVDEPTAHLSRADANVVMGYLDKVAQDRAVLLVTHHQEDAKDHADQVMLLAGGRLQECTPTAQFFAAPQTDIGRQFLGSGSAATIGLDTPDHHVHPDLRQPDFDASVRSAGASDRLHAIVDGQLYLLDVTDAPGSLESGFEVLSAAGLTTLIDLGDMGDIVPQTGVTCLATPEDMLAQCRMISAQIAAGEPVVFVRMGASIRAPRAIAMQLIFMGLSAYRAAKIASELRGLPVLDPDEEHALWDFELACALATDGIDPKEAQADPAQITWGPDVVARPRAARG